MNTLYFGDNLDVLREYVGDETVDLVYLDPPFNSQAQYNLVFNVPDGDAQAGAFQDTWAWGHEAEWAYTEVMRGGGDLARLVGALRAALGQSNMMAYLVMMTVRLSELRRKLKPRGSLYLHCDPTASHYLKVIMDAVFGPQAFKSEVVWKRSSAHNSARRWGPVHDVILFYSKSEPHTWNRAFQAYDQGYVDEFYTHFDKDKRRWRRSDLTGAGTRNGETGRPWRGIDVTAKGRHWFVPPAELEKLDQEGKIHWPAKADGMPMLKRYLDEQQGVPAQDLILDIPPLHNLARERLGYPTQKPVALLERIIAASSNPDDVVLDPFCGCGTTVDAAQGLGRRWIGIDIAVHAIKVIEARLEDQYKGAAKYELEGMPRDFASAVQLAERDKYQFQWWANYLFNPHALREFKKGADRGIDGELFFPNGPGKAWGRMLTSVKGGEHVGPEAVRAFARVLERERAELGLFICLHPPTREMVREAASVGLADVVHGDIPKLQIVAIEEWFKGRMPLLPPLEHLPSAAFSNRRRPAPTPKATDHNQMEFLFDLHGNGVAAKPDQDVIRHFNRKMVREIG